MNVYMRALCVRHQETMVCGTSKLPSPGWTGTSALLEETLTTLPSLESLQVQLVSASRWEAFSWLLTHYMHCNTDLHMKSNSLWSVNMSLTLRDTLKYLYFFSLCLPRLSLPTTKVYSREPSPRVELPFAPGVSSRTLARLLKRYITASLTCFTYCMAGLTLPFQE